MKTGIALVAASAALIMNQANASDLETAVYGKLKDGREAKIFTLTNTKGMVAKVTEYGAILVSLEVPDAKGKKADVTHGYDTLAGWETNTSYFGSTVGRFGNRIADGKFSLDGKEYSLVKNNTPGGIGCHLHGGTVGFDKVLWSGKPVKKDGARGVEFSYLAKDGEEGYPGNLSCKVTYWLTDNNDLVWDAEATTDKPTIVNMVHHTYWNLSGDQTKPITNHVLTLHADKYLPTNVGLIPTGKLDPVAGTPMDFTKPHVIGDRVGADFEALKFGNGYDHCWVLKEGKGVRLAAVLHDPVTGRTMEISTDQPAIQFYGGNFLDGSAVGKGGLKYQFRTACCLETEGFPDSPNKANFPSPVLRPGQTYKHVMIHHFK